MATRKGKTTFAEILMASGAGFGSSIVMGQLDKRVPVFTRNKNLSPLLIGAAALTGLYFLGDDVKPAAFGMLGASGSDMGNDVMNGLSRLSHTDEMLQGDIEDLEEALEEAQDQMDDMGYEETVEEVYADDDE